MTAANSSFIPSVVTEPEVKAVRFYVNSTNDVQMSLQQQAFARGVSFADLCGAVLTEWVRVGCPVFIAPAQLSDSVSVSPSSSPSPVVDDQGRGK